MTAAPALIVAGSILFMPGASLGVPRVFMEPDPNARLRLLQERSWLWRAVQPLYGLGSVLAATGMGALAAATNSTAGRILVGGAAVTMLAGVLAWCWDV